MTYVCTTHLDMGLCMNVCEYGWHIVDKTKKK